jgi:hypothetical protein
MLKLLSRRSLVLPLVLTLFAAPSFSARAAEEPAPAPTASASPTPEVSPTPEKVKIFEGKVTPIPPVEGDTTPEIADITVFTDDIVTVIQSPEHNNDWALKLTGRYSVENWTLISGTWRILPNSEGWFASDIPMLDPNDQTKQTFVLQAIDAAGATQKNHYSVELFPRRKFHFIGGLQTSYIHFEDNHGTNIGETMMTFRGGVTYDIEPGKWNAGLSGYYNLFPLEHSPKATTVANFWGVNARVTRVLEKPILGFQPSVSLGAFFWGMQVKDQSYGISETYGPQIYISGTHPRPGHSPYTVYFKYSPLSEGLSGFRLENHEFALGASMPFWTSFLGKLSVGLDLSAINVTLPDQGQSASIKTASLGLSKEF